MDLSLEESQFESKMSDAASVMSLSMKPCPSEFLPPSSDRCDLSWFEEDRPEFFRRRCDPMLGQQPDRYGSFGQGQMNPTQLQMIQHQQRLQQLHQRSLQQQQQLHQRYQFQQYQQQQPFGTPFQPMQFMPSRLGNGPSADLDFGNLNNAKLHKVLADHLPKSDLEQAVKLLRAILLQARPVKEQGRAKGMLTWPLPPCGTRPLPMLLELSDVAGALPWRERATEASLQASLAIYDNDPVQAGILGLVGLSQNRQTTLIPLKCWQLEASFPNAEVPYNPSKHSFFIELSNPGKHTSQPSKKVSIIGRLKQGGGPLRHEYCFSGSGLRYSYEPEKLFWIDQLPESSVDGRVVIDLVNKNPLDSNLDPVCKIKPLFGFGRIEFNFILRQAGTYMLQVSLELAGVTPPSAVAVVSQLSRELGEGLVAEAYYSCETNGQVKLKQNAAMCVAVPDLLPKPPVEMSVAMKMKEQLLESSGGSPLAQWHHLHQVQMQLRHRPEDNRSTSSRTSCSSLLPSTPSSPRSLNISISAPKPSDRSEPPLSADNVRMRFVEPGDSSPATPPTPESPRSLRSDGRPEISVAQSSLVALAQNSLRSQDPSMLARSESGETPRFLMPPSSSLPVKRPRRTQESSWGEERKFPAEDRVDPVQQLLQRLRIDSAMGDSGPRPEAPAVRRLTSTDNSTLHLRNNGAWPSDCHVYFHFDRHTCVQATEMINPYQPQDLVVCIPPIPRSVIETTISYINKAAQFNAKGVVLQPFVSANVVVATSPTITDPIYGYYTYPQSVLPPKVMDSRSKSDDDDEGDDDSDDDGTGGGPGGGGGGGGRFGGGPLGRGNMAGIVVDVTHKFFVPYNNLQSLIITCLGHLKFAPSHAQAHPVNLVATRGALTSGLAGAMQALLQFFVNVKLRDMGPGVETHTMLRHAFAQPVHHLVAEALIMFCARLEQRAVPDAILTPSSFRTMHLLCLLLGHSELQYLEEVIDSRLMQGCDVYRSETMFGLYPVDLLVRPENFGYGDDDDEVLIEAAEPEVEVSVHSELDPDIGEGDEDDVDKLHDLPQEHYQPQPSKAKSHPFALKETLKILALETDPNNKKPLPPNKPRSIETFQYSYLIKRACVLMALPVLILIITMVIVVFGLGGFRTTAPPIVLQAFQGAKGFGSETLGGLEGIIIPVTTLEATGEGSLQAAVDAPGPRTIVFQVAGTIIADIQIDTGDVTIAGESSPDPGVTIQGSLRVNAADNVVIRFLRVRPGPDLPLNAVYVGSSSNIVLDHLSLSWSKGPVIDMKNVENMTVSYSTIEEPGCARTGDHSKGVVATKVNGLSFHHNLVAHSSQYNPYLIKSTADIRNNVFYDFLSGLSASASQVNIVENHYKLTNEARRRKTQVMLWDLLPDCKADITNNFVSDLNVVRDFFEPNSQLMEPVNRNRFGVAEMQATNIHPFPSPDIEADAVDKVFTAVLDEAGCYPHDETTKRIKREVVYGVGWTGRKDSPMMGDEGVISVPAASRILPALFANLTTPNSVLKGSSEWHKLAQMAALKMKSGAFDSFALSGCEFNLTLVGATAFTDEDVARVTYAKQARVANITLEQFPRATYALNCSQEVFLMPPPLPPSFVFAGWSGYTHTLQYNPRHRKVDLARFLMPAANVVVQFNAQPNSSQFVSPTPA